MSAICAACMQPIPRGTKFTLAGTEVFHRTCVSRVNESRSWRTKQEILRLRGELERQRFQIEHLQQNLADADRKAGLAKGALEMERDEVKRLRVTVEALREVAAREARYREAAQARATAAEAAADRVAHDLAEQRKSKQQQSLDEPDTRDASAIRFSLLDLD